MELVEYEDRFVLRFDPCGSGQRTVRGDWIEGTPPRMEAPYDWTVVEGEYPWTHYKSGVCLYCVHCIVLMEEMPIDRFGYPVRVIDPPTYPDTDRDPKVRQKCQWHDVQGPDHGPRGVLHPGRPDQADPVRLAGRRAPASCRSSTWGCPALADGQVRAARSGDQIYDVPPTWYRIARRRDGHRDRPGTSGDGARQRGDARRLRTPWLPNPADEAGAIDLLPMAPVLSSRRSGPAVTEPVTPGTLHSQAYFDDPFPVWERLRHDQPLFHDTIDDRWLLTRYDDVAAVFRDHETYSTRPYLRIFTDVIGPTMVQMDGADHDVRRAIVAPAHGRPAAGAALPAAVDSVVEGLVRPAAAPAGRSTSSRASRRPSRSRSWRRSWAWARTTTRTSHDVTEPGHRGPRGRGAGRSDGIEAHAEFTRHIDGLIDERAATIPGRTSSRAIAQGRTESGERLSRAGDRLVHQPADGRRWRDHRPRPGQLLVGSCSQHPDALAAVRARPVLGGRRVLRVHAARRRHRLRGPGADPRRRVVRPDYPRRGDRARGAHLRQQRRDRVRRSTPLRPARGRIFAWARRAAPGAGSTASPTTWASGSASTSASATSWRARRSSLPPGSCWNVCRCCASRPARSRTCASSGSTGISTDWSWTEVRSGSRRARCRRGDGPGRHDRCLPPR